MASCRTSLVAVGASVPNRNTFKFATKHPVCSVSRKSKPGLIVVTRIGSRRHPHPLGLYSDCRTSCRVAKIMASSTTETEKFGIKIVKNPADSHLSELGVRAWPKWGCPPSKFPWTYSSKETCYLLEGKVKVYPDKSDEAVEIGAGDLVVFPKGMSCTWDVSEAVDKHYKFE